MAQYLHFPASKLPKDALYVPMHKEAVTQEHSHGILVEYMETKRYYELHIPNCPMPIPANDSAEIVSINITPWQKYNPYIKAYLIKNEIEYELTE